MRETCLDPLKLDTIGLAEAHLINKHELKLKNYDWYGHNRRGIHFRQKMESRGVGFLINKTVLKDNYVSILNDSSEGIMWLKLNHKRRLCSMLCLLSPTNQLNSTC